jgi:hypothetical protein
MTRLDVTSSPCPRVFVRAARRASARRAASVGATATATVTVTVVDEVERIGTDVHGQGDETRAERGDGGGPGR